MLSLSELTLVSLASGLDSPRKFFLHNVNELCFALWPFRAKAEDRSQRTDRSLTSGLKTKQLVCAPSAFAKASADTSFAKLASLT